MMWAVDDSEDVAHLPANSTSGQVIEVLRSDGCVIIDSFIPPSSLSQVQAELRKLVADAPFGENEFDGFATRRIFDPLARTRVLDDLLLHPLLAETVRSLIGPAQFGMTILSDVKPGEVAQRLHRDSSIYPLPFGFGPVELNTIWAIDDFNRTNGATVLSPGSHLLETSPSEYPSIALARATMTAGSVLFYDGRLVHGAGRNNSSCTRLALIVEHVVRWLRPAENHTLAVPRSIAVTLPEPLQDLLGYNQHGSFLGDVAGMTPSDWLKAGGEL
jgi:Phytanoyl-CoA dioxygenase (PhyH)